MKIILVFFSLIVFSCSPLIRQANVERVVKTLSSDQMQGRGNFEAGLKEASKFISNEFQQIGLQNLDKLNSFEQNFVVFGSQALSGNVWINEIKIETDHYFFSASVPKLELSKENTDFFYIKRGDDFRKKIAEMNMQNSISKDKAKAVFIHPSHQEIFKRYKKFYEQSALSLEEQKPTLLFVLAEVDEIVDFSVELISKINKLTSNNVVGVLKGKSKPNEYVIFSGHYDHLGILTAQNGDSIANGADDDASGVTAVIELARYFKAQANNERTLIFVAFAAEEIGGYGSQYFSKNLPAEQIVAMFNIEMIGKESKFGKKSAFITGFEKSDFGKILQKNLEGSVFQFLPDPYPEQNLFYRSDNATLAKLGVPAHTISSSQIDNDKLYHSVDDEFESLDQENITDLIKAIAQSATSIISGKDTPTRIKD